ncbi:MAG: rRNA pseudouridine synthase [Ruminococcaceae bacterium]|nr:rRNA pseudouridine synthase [Oscillospiraceae bacterium]
MNEIRLQKFFSDAGVMSRRHAEAAIADGRVTVNGVVAEVGMKVDPWYDTVTLDGREIRPRTIEEYTYIMLNKPAGYVTTLSDEKGRADVTELIGDLGKRVYPIGRLDMYSEGLLLLTDDGETANKIMHPSSNIGKVYAVRLRGNVSAEDVKKLEAPMELDGYKLCPVNAEIVSSSRKTGRGENVTDILVTLMEGRNRQIRRMCEMCGLTILRLRRISEGEITLGNLPAGKWRHLTDEEVAYLKGI